MKLSTLYKHFANHPEGGWIMEWPNARQLYNHVKETQPKNILDLGTGIGCTAAVVALALENTGVKDYQIHTVEQTQKCYDLAQHLIPDELKKNTHFYQKNPIVWETEQIPYYHFSIFESLPDGEWDLIITDGPGPWVEDEKYIELPNADVMKMLLEGKLKKGAQIAWDKRLPAIKLLERYFSDNFYLVRQNFNPIPFHVLEVKDPEPKYRDERLEQMQSAGYFQPVENS